LINEEIILSVSITAYNMEKYVARAIESVLSQKTNFAYEIIVADDCSTDNTIPILQAYQQKLGERFVILYAEKNRGLIANYVNSLKAAKGKYIASLDADDYWIDENKLQKQADILNKNEDVGYVHTNFYYEEEVSKKRRLARSLHYRPSENNVFIDNLLNFDIYLGSSCIRKSALDFNELAVFVDKKFHAQDYPIFLTLALKTKEYYLPEPTAIYSLIINSMSRQVDVKKNIDVKNKTFAISQYFIAKYSVPILVQAKIKFQHKFSVLLAAWVSHDFNFVKQYTRELHLRDFLKYNPKATYIYIASKNKFLYMLLIPWVLRKRRFGR